MDTTPSNQAENCDAPLLIVGMSVRAAAMSACRAGILFYAIDLFADRDLRDLASARGVARISNLAALADAHLQFPNGPWMYTGGLENKPALVRQISRTRELLGNSSTVLRLARNPDRLRDTLFRSEIPHPEMCVDTGPPASGIWLWKPLRSGGGRHIQFARSHKKAHRRNGYFQEWIDGSNASGIYLASRNDCRLVGTTQQILRRDLMTDKPHPSHKGRDPLQSGHHPFQYVGSIVGPQQHVSTLREQWERIGLTLWRAFGLVGLFGVDAVIRERAGKVDEVVPIEVNPRYTASVELLERALAIPAVASHCAACRGKEFSVGERSVPPKWFGKGILYATDKVVIDDSFLNFVDHLNTGATDGPSVADIPGPGTTIHTRQPIATVLASADTREELLQRIGWQGTDGLLQQLQSALH